MATVLDLTIGKENINYFSNKRQRFTPVEEMENVWVLASSSAMQEEIRLVRQRTLDGSRPVVPAELTYRPKLTSVYLEPPPTLDE